MARLQGTAPKLSRQEIGVTDKSTRPLSKKDAIIAAAKELFLLEGFAGASVDRITMQANVSKSTVYSYFRSKEEMFLAVVDSIVLPFHQDYRAVLEREAEFEHWLLDLALTVARKAAEPDVVALARLGIAESLRFPQVGRTFRQVAVDASLDLFRPRFEEAMAAGILRMGDVDFAVMRFLDACGSELRAKLFYPGDKPMSKKSAQRHAELVVEFFLHGFGNHSHHSARSNTRK